MMKQQPDRKKKDVIISEHADRLSAALDLICLIEISGIPRKEIVKRMREYIDEMLNRKRAIKRGSDTALNK